jgi:hypothetical protein
MIKDINNIDPKLLEEDDRIVAYLKGQMTAEEEQQFLKELEENPELKEKAIATARLVKGLKQVGEEQDNNIRGAFLASSEQGVAAVAKRATQDDRAVVAEQKAIIAKQEKTGTYYRKVEQGQKAKTVSMRKVSAWLAAAASLIFIIWIGFTYNDYRTTTGLGEEYGGVFSSERIVRGAEMPSAAQEKLEILFTDVKNGENLDNAIHELSLCWELSTMETLNDYTDYTAEIGWNLVIAYLKDNNKKEAKVVLEKMSTRYDENTAVGKKVRELESKLE